MSPDYVATNTLNNASPMAAMEALFTARGAKGLTRETRHQVAVEFESMFLAQMLSSMFESENQGADQENGLFGNMQGDDVYRSMMTEQYAKQIARSGGIGIAEYVENELLKLQELPPVQGKEGL